MEIIKNTRTEEKELRTGRIGTRVVTTWDIVENGSLVSEHSTSRAAKAEYRRLERIRAEWRKEERQAEAIARANGNDLPFQTGL